MKDRHINRQDLINDLRQENRQLKAQIETMENLHNRIAPQMEDEIKQLKEQNTNLQVMLVETRAVRINEDYLKKVMELEEQIEKMKCCENCKFWDSGGWEGYCKLSQYKKPCEDWQLKE